MRSPSRAARTAPGKAARRAGSKSPLISIRNSSPRVEAGRAAAPARVDHRRAQRPVRHPAHQPGEVRQRVGGERVAAAAAERAQHARHGLERGPVERVGAGRLDHRVEHQPLDVGRVRERVAERHLHAVRGPVEGDLLEPERAPGSPRCPRPSRGSCSGGGSPPAASRKGRRPGRRGTGWSAPARGSAARPERPVPRWSKTIRSRRLKAGESTPAVALEGLRGRLPRTPGEHEQGAAGGAASGHGCA